MEMTEWKFFEFELGDEFAKNDIEEGYLWSGNMVHDAQPPRMPSTGN